MSLVPVADLPGQRTLCCGDWH